MRGKTLTAKAEQQLALLDRDTQKLVDLCREAAEQEHDWFEAQWTPSEKISGGCWRRWLDEFEPADFCGEPDDL